MIDILYFRPILEARRERRERIEFFKSLTPSEQRRIAAWFHAMPHGGAKQEEVLELDFRPQRKVAARAR